MEEEEQTTEIQVEEQTTDLQGQVLVPISGQETVIIATSETGQGVPATVTIDQLAQAAHQSFIQVPTTSEASEDGGTTIQQVQIQEAELQPGEAIQTVQIEPGETIQTVHFDPNGETTVHIQGTDTTIPVHIQPAETLQPVQIQSVHMGLTSSTGDHVVVPATETLQQVVHISSQPAVTVQAQNTTTETVNSVPPCYPTEPVESGWEHIFMENYTPYEGYVDSLEEVHRLITAYEIATVTKFVKTRCSGKLFGVVRFDKKCRIWWEDIRDTKGVVLKYDGTPFVIMGSRMMSCIFGPDNNKNYKQRAQEERVRLSLSGIDDNKKRRQVRTPSKKMGCPAMISIRHIVRFPRHQIDQDDVVHRRQAAITLKEDFMDGVRLPYEERFYVCLPDPVIHQGHPDGEEAMAKDSLDERIIAKIHELVAQGIDKISDIHEQLIVFVTDELFKGSTPPPTTWRRFYPKKNDIRNQVYRAKGLKSAKPKDDLAMAIQAVGGIEDGTGEGGTSDAVNKPQLNRLRFQCRDKLKLLIDMTHICNNTNTLQALLGVLSNLHSEMWSELLSGRGDTSLKAEDVAAAAAAAAEGYNGSGSGDSKSQLISWPTTGLLHKPQKKRGRKRKEETVVDTEDPYARTYFPRKRGEKTLDERYKDCEIRVKKAKKASYNGPKRRPGRPRKHPFPVSVSTTVSQPGDEMEIVTIDISTDVTTDVGIHNKMEEEEGEEAVVQGDASQ